MGVLRVGPASSRAEIEDAMATIRRRQRGLPANDPRRDEYAAMLDDCLDWWDQA